MGNLLSDKDVGLLSDEEVFGSAPASPKRQVGFGEAAFRKAKEVNMNAVKNVGLAASVIPGVIDKAAELVTGNNPGLQDLFFKHVVAPADQAAQADQLQPTEQYTRVGGNLGAGVGALGDPLLLATMAAPSAVATKALPVISDAAVGLAPAVARVAKHAAPAATAATLPAYFQGRDRTAELEAQGVDPVTANVAGIAQQANTVAGMVTPMSVGSALESPIARLLSNGLQGAAAMPVVGAGGRSIENAILSAYPKQQQPITSVEQLASEIPMGFAFGAAGGGRKQVAQTPEQIAADRVKYNRDNWGNDTGIDGAELLPMEPKPEQQPAGYSADANSKPAPADGKKTNPVEDRLFQAAGGAAAPDLELVPKQRKEVAANPKSNPSPDSISTNLSLEGDGPNRVLSDSDLRNISKAIGISDADVLAMPRHAQEALRDHANSFVESKSSFDLADRRQRQADADLANRGELGPDYQSSGAAAHGGQFDSGVRGVTLLDAQHKGGKLVGGEAVDVLDPSRHPAGKDGNLVVKDGNGNTFEVEASRLSDHQIPADQRLAQDFNARSDTPPKGVGEQTMRDEKMPRQSTDRISGDEVGGKASAVGDPYHVERGPVEGQLHEPGPKRLPEREHPAARQPQAYEGEMPSAFDGKTDGQPAIEGRTGKEQPRQIKQTSSPESRTPLLPDNHAPSGDTRFAVDSRGRAVDRNSPPNSRGVEGRPVVERDAPNTTSEAPIIEPAKADSAPVAEQSEKPASKKKPQPERSQRSQLLNAIRKAGGIDPSHSVDLTGDNAAVSGRKMPRVFRKGGMSSDGLLEFMQQNGWLGEHADIRDAQSMIRDAFDGREISPHDSTAVEDSAAAREEAAYREHLDRLESDPEYAAEYNDRAREVKAEEGLADTKPINDALKTAEEFLSRFGEDALEELALKHTNDADAFTKEARRMLDEENKNATDSGSGKEDAQVGAGEKRSFDLEQQTEQGLRDRAEREAQSERAASDRELEAENKAKADAEVGDFGLTGSDRPADANPNQGDLLGNSSHESKPSSDPRAEKRQQSRDKLDSILQANDGKSKVKTDDLLSALHHAQEAGLIDHWTRLTIEKSTEPNAVNMARLKAAVEASLAKQGKKVEGTYGTLSSNPFANPAAYKPVVDAIKQAFGATAAAAHRFVDKVFGARFENGMVPDSTFYGNIVRHIQDKFTYLRQVQERIEKEGGSKLDDDANAYQRETVMHGRRGNRIAKFEREFVDQVHTIVKQIHKNLGVSLDDINSYLVARHAQERNESVAKRNGLFADGGSGMTTAEAAKVLADFKSSGKLAGLDRLGKVTDGIAAHQRQLMLDYGLIDKATFDRLAQYKHYVPLKGEWFETMYGFGRGGGTGSGLNIPSKPVKSATGSFDMPTNSLMHLLADTENIIVIGEKNRVNQSLLKLVRDNPAPELWRIDEKQLRAVLGKDGTVRYQESSVIGDNVIRVRENGVQYDIHFDPAASNIYEPLKNIGDKSGVPVIQQATRFMAGLATSFNPEFVATNLARDLQSAILNSIGDGVPKKVSQQFANPKNIAEAIQGVYRAMRGKDESGHDWQQWFNKFSEAGGETFFLDRKGHEETKADLEHAIKSADGDWIARSKDSIGLGLKLIADANGAVENATRLIYFRSLVEHGGMTPEKAAAMAKDVTVNFNRKGQMSSLMSSIYMFFNASVQGSARALKTMAGSSYGRAAAGVLAAGGMALSEMNRLNSDTDEDGRLFFDKIPDGIKSKWAIMMVPSYLDGVAGLRAGQDYIKIAPLAYGFNVPFSVGTAASDVKAGRSPVSAAANVASTLMSSFDPFGDGGLLAHITPSVFHPLVELSTNNSWFGKPIYKTAPAHDDNPPPRSQNYGDRATETSKHLAEWLNSISGGDKVFKGAIDLPPEAIDYAAGAFGGGLGKVLKRIYDVGDSVASGKGVDPANAPFMHILFGKNDAMPFEDYKAALADIGNNEEARKSGRADVRNGDLQPLEREVKKTEKAQQEAWRKIKKIRGDDSLDEADRREAIKAIESDMQSKQKLMLDQYYSAGGKPSGW